MVDTPGLPARRAALRMMDAVLHRGETLEQAERSALRHINGPADRALARAIASEVMRWLVDLDLMIDSATRNRLADDAKARSVLRLMLVQWLRFDTPPHAVIATALPLLTGGPRRLAHGVFSTLSKREVTLPDGPTPNDAALLRWGEHAAAVMGALAEPPPLDLALKDHGETQKWTEELGGVSLAPGHVRLQRGTPVDELPGFEQGAWWVQDIAASLPARLLGPGNAKRVLDLCAAPGGKTMQLAAAGWDVTALDISERRLELLRGNLDRTGLMAQVITADAQKWDPPQPYDAILLDAPCTATGTCRRHPDVLHRIGQRQIHEMAQLQQTLLARAAGWLAPGGTLVYAVCSLEEEEGAGQAGNVPLSPMPITAQELPAGLLPDAQGWLRTDPSMLPEAGGLDGFFIGRWTKP